MKNRTIGIILLLFGTMLLIGSGALIVLANNTGGLLGGGSQLPAVVYECNGEIKVPNPTADLLGFDASLDNVQCRPENCGLFSGLSFVSDVFGSEGSVSMSVDGKIVASKKWDSLLGLNQEFTLRSACVEEGSVDVILYDEQSNVIMSQEVLK